MKNEKVKTLQIAYNASGAAQAALRADVVMIVDVIDMSTTAEAVLEAGALAVLGASPNNTRVPVAVNPQEIGYQVGKIALKNNSGIIVITEPRFGELQKKLTKIQLVREGIESAGAQINDILPNVGAQITSFSNFDGQVVVIVSNSGGVAFDAAYNQGAAAVMTGTVARTACKQGIESIKIAAKRAIKGAKEYETGITLVAASSNAYEDILAVERIAKEIIALDFLRI